VKTCPYCAHSNREGVFFCEECGQPFVGGKGTTTTSLLQPEEQNNFRGRSAWGTARFDRDASIVIHVRDHTQPLSVVPKEEIVIGRSDAQASAVPDLDLSPFGGVEHGVSRRHAIIRRGEDTLTLIDLGSTNGTHLNGQRLIPQQPRVLRDGDEIRLGRLVFHIFFK
jgi:pSer/pThr/pTyr-binding forkhead associated (FHA) protein